MWCRCLVSARRIETGLIRAIEMGGCSPYIDTAYGGFGLQDISHDHPEALRERLAPGNISQQRSIVKKIPFCPQCGLVLDRVQHTEIGAPYHGCSPRREEGSGHSSTVVISGIVISDPIVETKTICDASRASAPYCSAKTTVFTAAGIAAIVIMTPLTRGSEKIGEKR